MSSAVNFFDARIAKIPIRMSAFPLRSLRSSLDVEGECLRNFRERHYR